MVLADASVLIALAKMGRLTLLKQVFGRVMVSPAVKQEVVDRGLAMSAPEVIHVQQALQERWLRVARLAAAETALAQRLLSFAMLGAGEAESLAVAKQRGATLLVDEKQARTAARAMGVEVMGTAGVLLEAFRVGKLSADELEAAVRDLGRVTWLSPNVVADVLGRARGVKS